MLRFYNSSWTTQIGKAQPVLEEPGTDGPGNVGPQTDCSESVSPGADGPGSAAIP
jgi:hypothetical protein